MNGYPPVDAASRITKDKLHVVLSRLRGVYSDNLIELVQWCMALDPQARPQSVFALQKQLSDLSNLRYQEKTLTDRLRAGIGKLIS